MKRLARIDGTLSKRSRSDGILGISTRADTSASAGRLGLRGRSWGITQVSLNMTGKILMFKDINIVSDEVLSDFIGCRTADICSRRGMLKIEEVKPGHNFTRGNYRSQEGSK